MCTRYTATARKRASVCACKSLRKHSADVYTERTHSFCAACSQLAADSGATAGKRGDTLPEACLSHSRCELCRGCSFATVLTIRTYVSPVCRRAGRACADVSAQLPGFARIPCGMRYQFRCQSPLLRHATSCGCAAGEHCFLLETLRLRAASQYHSPSVHRRGLQLARICDGGFNTIQT